MATPTTNFNLLKPSTGETYNVQTLDDNYDKIDKQLGLDPELYGVSTCLVGTSPLGAASPVVKIQGGTDVLNFAANTGLATLTFPRPFPNGLVSLVVANGDTQVDQGNGVNWDLGVNTSGASGNVTASQAVIQILSSTGTIPTVAHSLRVNWIALGW